MCALRVQHIAYYQSHLQSASMLRKKRLEKEEVRVWEGKIKKHRKLLTSIATKLDILEETFLGKQGEWPIIIIVNDAVNR